MNFRSFSRCIVKVSRIVMLICMAMSISSCEPLFEDSEPCPQGLRLRFIYDYNMEYANAFPSQVDCLTLLIYDKNGKYLHTCHATSDQTSDENWRMEIDLPAGDYSLLAYGGIDCKNASFRFVEGPSQSRMQNLEVELPMSLVTSPEGTRLHPLFYGALDVTVPDNAEDYTESTVSMMKDTNNLRILLQNVDGTPVDNKDFTFIVTADNLLFDYRNNVIPSSPAIFHPWAQGTEIAGSDAEAERPVEVGYAEFSLSRLTATSTPRLEIKRVDDSRTVLSIPLTEYLLLLKSQEFQSLSAQEFLDRESRWDMIFFLDGNDHWISTQIVINNWIVRLNNIDDFD